MTYSVRNIVIALVLAAVAAGLVILYTGNVQKQAHDSQQNVTVVVAKSAIAAGSPVKDLVSTNAFETRQVVQRDVVPGAYTSVSALNSDLATAGPITAGSQITPSMFTEGTSAPIASQITGTMRAVQVAYNPNRVLDGTLHGRRPRRRDRRVADRSRRSNNSNVHQRGCLARPHDERPGALDEGRRRRRGRPHRRLRHERRRRLRTTAPRAPR